MIGIDQAFAPLHGRAAAKEPVRKGADWQAILPVPDNAPSLARGIADRFAPSGFGFTQAWPYHDPSGRPLGIVVRYDLTDRTAPRQKQLKPFYLLLGAGRPAGMAMQELSRAAAALRPRPTRRSTERPSSHRRRREGR